MPVDIRIEMEHGTGKVLMRRSPESKAEEDRPFMEIPVIDLGLSISPRRPIVANAAFVSLDADVVLNLCVLAEPRVYTTICFYCKAILQRKAVQVTSNPKMTEPVWGWFCDCKGDVDELHHTGST
jgi:hypothetical protein